MGRALWRAVFAVAGVVAMTTGVAAQDEVVVTINPLPLETALVATVDGKEVPGRYGFPANLFDPNKSIEVWEVVCPDGTKIVLKDATVPWPGMYDACEKRRRLGAFLWGSGNPSFDYPGGREAVRRWVRPFLEAGFGLSSFTNAGASCDTIRGRYVESGYDDYDCTVDGSDAGFRIGGGIDVGLSPRFGIRIGVARTFGGDASNTTEGTGTFPPGVLRFQQDSDVTFSHWSIEASPYASSGAFEIGPTLSLHRWSNEIHTTGSLRANNVTVRTDDVTTSHSGTALGIGAHVSYSLTEWLSLGARASWFKAKNAFEADEPGGWERDRDDLGVDLGMRFYIP